MKEPNPEQDEEDDSDVILETHAAPHGLPKDCPFTFLYLSSEDSNRDEPLDVLTNALPSSDDLQKQGVSHIPVTAERVLDSDGQTRLKWMEAGRKELDNLTNTGTVEPISSERKDQIKVEARKKGLKYVELSAKRVFTMKTDKFKVRIVACSNKRAETYGNVSTTDLDTAMMRYLLSWGASSSSHAVASLDVTAAFMKAPLPLGRVVVMRPPTILYKLQLLPPGHVWLVHKAIHGLREAPTCGQEERTDAMTQVTFIAEREPYSVILSEIHKSQTLTDCEDQKPAKEDGNHRIWIDCKGQSRRGGSNEWHTC